MIRKNENQWRLVALFYLAAVALSLGLATLVRDGRPLEHPAPWLKLGGAQALLLSGGLGLVFALLVAASTRVFVARFGWASRLRDELRPSIRGLSAVNLLQLAALSSAAEELFFRSLLEPAAGLVLSSVAFGLAHQMRGPSRWVWATWSAAVGLGLGGVYHLTGSLVGALLAHALINAINMFFLRDSGLSSPGAGGLFGRPGARPRP